MIESKYLIQAREIIKSLNSESKSNVKSIIRTIGISRQSFYNKFNELKDQKIISNFTININPSIRPTNLKYVMLAIKTNPTEPLLVKELIKIPQLRMLDGIFGEYSLFALFIFRSSEEYYQTLNDIDRVMATSYFKKYQINETIRVFKTNGINIERSGKPFEEELLNQLIRKINRRKIDETNLYYKDEKSKDGFSLDIKKKIDLDLMARLNPDLEYDPERFPGLIMRIENLQVTTIIFSTGRIIITGIKEASEAKNVVAKIFSYIRETGIKIKGKKVDLNFKIDKIDEIILDILQDGQKLKPISTYEIKHIFNEQHQIEISQSTIHNRIKKLEREGIILNYTINFSPKKIGFEGKYLLRIKPRDPSKYEELALKLVQFAEITDLFRIGEEYGLLAIVRVKKIGDYGNFIRNLYLSEEIEDTFTNFVLDELKPCTNFLIF